MKISIFGAGYLGLTSSVCLAHENNQVTCIDIDAERVELLNSGKVQIHEPGLEKLLQSCLAREQLSFVLEADTVELADLIIIAVGTPTDVNGHVSLNALFSVCDIIAAYLSAETLVVIESTVPVGTTRRFKARLQQRLHERGLDWTARVAYVPLFLRNAYAIKDFQFPDRIIAGVTSQQDAQLLADLFKPFIRHAEQWLTMDPASAELTKYAANAMLASRISFMNEIANLAQAVGADAKHVQRGIGSDRRIGSQFLNSGLGFGGSCFPEDLRGILQLGDKNAVDLPLMNAILTTNNNQIDAAFNLIEEVSLGSFRGKTFAVWGLAFKAGSDDIRESPALHLIQRLLDVGATIRAYDPLASHNVRAYFGETLNFLICDTPQQCLTATDGLLVLTEEDCFAEFPVATLANHLHGLWVFDGRNILPAQKLIEAGIQYLAIGRVIDIDIIPEEILQTV